MFGLGRSELKLFDYMGKFNCTKRMLMPLKKSEKKSFSDESLPVRYQRSLKTYLERNKNDNSQHPTHANAVEEM